MANEAAASIPKVVPPARPVKPTDEQLSSLKAQWGNVFYMRVADCAVVVRQFNEAEWDRFQGGIERGTAVVSTKDLLAGCVVWSSEPLEGILARRPAYGKKFTMGLIEWAGSGDQIEKKEL